jgi:hypothetical protein
MAREGVFANESKPVPAMFALDGVENIQDTNPHNVDFFALLFPEDTVVASATLDPVLVTGGGTLDGRTVLAGTYLPFHGSSITLTSGWCVAAKRKA